MLLDATRPNSQGRAAVPVLGGVGEAPDEGFGLLFFLTRPAGFDYPDACPLVYPTSNDGCFLRLSSY